MFNTYSRNFPLFLYKENMLKYFLKQPLTKMRECDVQIGVIWRRRQLLYVYIQCTDMKIDKVVNLSQQLTCRLCRNHRTNYIAATTIIIWFFLHSHSLTAAGGSGNRVGVWTDLNSLKLSISLSLNPSFLETIYVFLSWNHILTLEILVRLEYWHVSLSLNKIYI